MNLSQRRNALSGAKDEKGNAGFPSPTPSGPGEGVLTVSDNGIGLPSDVDLMEPRTLGLQIIQSLVGQLDGQLEVVRRGGTTFRIRFPLGR